MTQNALDRLRAADPARGVDPAVSEPELRRLVAQPRPRHRARRRVARPAVVVTAMAGVAALLGTGAALLGDGGGPGLAERAYAQVRDDDAVLYTRVVSRTVVTGPPHGRQTFSHVVEEWRHGKAVHVIVRRLGGPRLAPTHQVLDARGVLRLRTGRAKAVVRSSDHPSSRRIIARIRRGFAAAFRRDYEAGRLDPSGGATFAGRPARRYVVEGPTAHGRREYFVDAESGAPLGSVVRHAIWGGDAVQLGRDGEPRAVGKPNGTLTTTDTVQALERLPATKEHLAKVAG